MAHNEIFGVWWPLIEFLCIVWLLMGFLGVGWLVLGLLCVRWLLMFYWYGVAPNWVLGIVDS